MATVDVPWDWFALRMKAYQYIVKVRKFQLHTAYLLSTAEGRTSLWADSASQPLTWGLIHEKPSPNRLPKMFLMNVRNCLWAES